MRFWACLLGIVALFVAGSVALAGTAPEPKADADATDAKAAPKPAPVPAEKPQPAKPAAAKPASLAAKNGLIAVRGPDAVYLVDPDSAQLRKIPETADLTEPAWAPDGSVLALSGGDSVYTIRPDGSHRRLVISDATSPSWSEDGKRLFAEIVSFGNDEDVGFVSTRRDGGDLRRVTFEDEDFSDAREPAVPADGKWLGFFQNVQDASGPASFDSSAASWSPDDSHVAFVSAEASDTAGSLWVVDAEGNNLKLLMRGASGRPSWG